METKKVIEQENKFPTKEDIIRESKELDSENIINSSYQMGWKEGAYWYLQRVEKVAKAICPKYQELEDERDKLQKQVEFFKTSATNLSADKNKFYSECLQKDEKISELVRHKQNLLKEIDSLNRQLIDAGLKQPPITQNTKN